MWLNPRRSYTLEQQSWRTCLPAQVRAKLGSVLATTVGRADAGAWAALDVSALLRAAARLVGDNTPEARDAGRRLVALVHAAFQAGQCAGALADGVDGRRSREGTEVHPPPGLYKIYTRVNPNRGPCTGLLRCAVPHAGRQPAPCCFA